MQHSGFGRNDQRWSQIGTCNYVIFDIGDGGAERLFGLQIPTAFLDKILSGIYTETISATSGRCLWQAVLRGVSHP
jgi:hypothetical protein